MSLWLNCVYCIYNCHLTMRESFSLGCKHII